MTTDVLKVSGNYLLDASNGNIILDVTNSNSTGTVTIIGNLDVLGETTQLETTNSSIKDNIIVINSGETNNYVTLGTSGILIGRGNSDSIVNAASFLYDDGSNWTNSSGDSYQGVFNLNSAQQGSAIRVNAIRVESTVTSLNIFGVENPNAVMNVKGTTNYENNLFDDDDIPNKKYVDSAVYSGTDFAKRIQVGNTFVRIADNSINPLDPYYNSTNKIFAALGTTTNVVFRLEGTVAQIQGLTIDNNTIIVNNTATDLLLQPQAGSAVKVESPLKLQKVTSVPIAEINQDTLYYTGIPQAGGTGLYFVNTTEQDELTSRRRAIVYGIIF
jgi:hypothetical protein